MSTTSITHSTFGVMRTQISLIGWGNTWYFCSTFPFTSIMPELCISLSAILRMTNIVQQEIEVMIQKGESPSNNDMKGIQQYSLNSFKLTYHSH